MRVPCTARRPNLKEISPEYSLEGLMLKLKLQILATWWEELTHLKRPWCWERLRAGVEGDNRGWNGWMASPTRWTWIWVNSGSCWWTGRPGMLWSMASQKSDMTEQMSWTETNERRKNVVRKFCWILVRAGILWMLNVKPLMNELKSFPINFSAW